MEMLPSIYTAVKRAKMDINNIELWESFADDSFVCGDWRIRILREHGPVIAQIKRVSGGFSFSRWQQRTLVGIAALQDI